MSETIVVVGRREKQPDGSFVIQFSVGTGVPGIRFVSPREVSPDDQSLDPELEVAVKIEKTKVETDQARMEEAAKKLIKGIMTVLTKLQTSNPAAIITPLGYTVTVGDMIETLKNTIFTVSDVDHYRNKGVGTADRGENGQPNRDTINYLAIEGYAAWPNDSGLHAIVLHEAGHMTVAGDAFFERSKQVQLQDPTVSREFYETEYAPNLEAFANSIMSGIAAEVGLNLYGIQPGTSEPPQTPEAIFEANNGHPFPG